MVLPVKGVHCIPGVKYLSLVGTIDQSVGASTSTGSLTSSVPSSSEGSVNTFQQDNLPASETQLSSTEFNATLTQVKAKMLPYNLKQARDIAAGRRRRVHEATSKAFTGFSNDCLLLPSPPPKEQPCRGTPGPPVGQQGGADQEPELRRPVDRPWATT